MPSAPLDANQPTDDSPGGGQILRLADILVATALILVLTPMIALVAALSYRPNLPLIQRRRSAAGPGRHFTVYEFNAEDGPSDDKDIRRHSLSPRGIVRLFRGDQLPQLINVIRGELSFFGFGSRPRLFAD